MGCSSCKAEKEVSAEEKALKAFEFSLNFLNLDPVHIDRVLHRYSLNGGMSISQFERAFGELGLKFNDYSDFWYKFYDSYAYNMKRLNCLGVLLTNDTASKKLKILFQNYDTHTVGSLTKEQLHCMIDDLMIVACEILPKGTLRYQGNAGNLKTYARSIKSVRKSIIRQLVSTVLDGKTSINERQLSLSYQQDEGIRYLLDTRAMREYCFHVKTNLIGSVDNIINKINSSNKDQIITLIKQKSGKKARKSRASNVCKEVEDIIN